MEEDIIIENPNIRVGPGIKISLLMLFGPIVLIILLVVLIGSTGRKEKNEKKAFVAHEEIIPTERNDPTLAPSEIVYKLVNSCSGDECLFENKTQSAVEGFAKLKGYYHQYDSIDMEKKVVCNSIIVTGGSERLIRHFNEWIAGENTINKKDKDGNLMVNIEIDNLENDIKQKITSSTMNNQIELGVIRITPVGRGGVSTCISFVDIIYAKDVR
jgi:hypothetical protein